MNRINKIISISVSSITFVVTFYSIWKFISFLSNIQSSGKIIHLMQHTKLDSEFEQIILPLIKNTCLMGIFTIPHSILPKLKPYFSNDFELSVLSRSVYVLISSLSLLVLTHFWNSIYLNPIWAVNANDGFNWWLFSIIHATAWIFLYGGILLVDITELLGIKQVYYKIKGWKSPMSYKSKKLQELYQHVRHPGIISLTIILWICPVLTLDRLVLALTWTSWMIFAWKTDKKDVEYLVEQFVRKKSELTPNNSFSTSFIQ